MHWFKRQNNDHETLLIGKTIVMYPHGYHQLVRQAVDLRSELESHATDRTVIERARTVWNAILVLPHIQDTASELYSLAHAELGMASARLLATARTPPLINEIIRSLSIAIESDTGHPADRSRWYGALCATYRHVYEMDGQEQNLDQSITYGYKALELAHNDSLIRGKALNNLANALRLRGEQGDLEDAEAAARVFDEALSIARQPKERTIRLIGLAGCLIRIFELKGKREDLERALDLLDEAKPGLVHDDVQVWYTFHNTLATARYHSYCLDLNLAQLDSCFEIIKKVLDSSQVNATYALSIRITLGLAHAARWEALGQASDLDMALGIYQQARLDLPVESPTFGRMVANLGTALLDQAAFQNTPEGIEQAIQKYNQILSRLSPGGHPWRMICHNLSIAYKHRYHHRPNLSDLDIALGYAKQAIASAPHDLGDLSSWYNSLGTLYHARFEARGDLNDLHHAVQAYDYALLHTPGRADTVLIKANYAVTLLARFRLQHTPQDLHTAEAHLLEAYRFYDGARQPDRALRVRHNLGSLYGFQDRWHDASQMFMEGIELLNTLYHRQLFAHNRDSWLKQASYLSREAAYALIKLGRLKDAIVVLESSRARRLMDLLDLERLPQLQASSPELWQQFNLLRTRIMTAENRQRQWKQPTFEENLQVSLDLGEEIASLVQQIDLVAASIRQQPGFEEFWAEPSVESILVSIPATTALVYGLSSPFGGVALLAYQDQDNQIAIEPVWLHTLDDGAVHSMIYGTSTMEGWKDALDLQASINIPGPMNSILKELWDRYAYPLICRLSSLGIPKVWYLPMGALALLPLQAAWNGSSAHGSYVIDHLEIVYLLSARMLRTHIRQAKPGGYMVAIADPKPRGKMEPLRGAWQETQSIMAAFPHHTILHHHHATYEAVLRELMKAEFFHSACHARSNPDNPLASALFLANEQPLTVKDILGIPTAQRELAVLSACMTALVSESLPDEALTLQAAFLYVGFKGVVATQWAIHDAAAALLMVRFYTTWQTKALHPHEALREAQLWLRDTNNNQKHDYIEELVKSQRLSSAAYHYFEQHLTPNNSYAHPQQWAAFTYLGA